MATPRFARAALFVAACCAMATLLAVVIAEPCDQQHRLTLRDELKHADAILSGVVKRVETTTRDSPDPTKYDVRVQLTVHQVWVGPKRPKIAIWTQGDGECGVSFETGRAYVVFATLARGSKAFVTDQRHLTGRFPEAGDLVLQLGVPWWTNDSPLDRR